MPIAINEKTGRAKNMSCPLSGLSSCLILFEYDRATNYNPNPCFWNRVHSGTSSTPSLESSSEDRHNTSVDLVRLHYYLTLQTREKNVYFKFARQMHYVLLFASESLTKRSVLHAQEKPKLVSTHDRPPIIPPQVPRLYNSLLPLSFHKHGTSLLL
jgi:hypothetical protein